MLGLKFRGVNAAGKRESTFALLEKYMAYDGIFLNDVNAIYDSVAGPGRKHCIISIISLSAERETNNDRPVYGGHGRHHVIHFISGATVVFEYFGELEHTRAFVKALKQFVEKGRASGRGFWARVEKYSISLAKDADLCIGDG